MAIFSFQVMQLQLLLALQITSVLLRIKMCQACCILQVTWLKLILIIETYDGLTAGNIRVPSAMPAMSDKMNTCFLGKLPAVRT